MESTSQYLQFGSKLLNQHHSFKCSSEQRCFELAIFLKTNKCNNSSTSCPDKLSWSYLKTIIKDGECTNKLINIANSCINLGHWPSHFKTLTTIIISKLNKILYDSTKSFCPIVLLNTTGKLCEKMIGEWLQFLLISNNFIHPC